MGTSDFLHLLAGSVAWPVLQSAWFGGRHLFRRLRSTYPLEGDWNCYHYRMIAGEVRPFHRGWRVRKGLRWKYVGKIRDGNSDNWIYRFRVREEKGDFLFSVSSLVDEETFYVRTKGTFVDAEQSFFGLHLALNFNSKVYAGMKIFSRSVVSDTQLENLIQNNFTTYRDRPLVVVDQARAGI